MPEWLRRLLFPDDPRFCANCGGALKRGEDSSFDEKTGERIPRPYAACPVFILGPRWLGPGRGGWEVSGNWPTHTIIFREPRWRDD